MATNLKLCQAAEEFAHSVLYVYLVKRDFEGIKTMLHPDITWCGANGQICRNYEEALTFLNAELRLRSGERLLRDISLSAAQLSDKAFMVSGEFIMDEDGEASGPIEVRCLFSCICLWNGIAYKLFHAHISIPGIALNEDQISTKTFENNCSVVPEREPLAKHENAFAAISESILVGVEVCGVGDKCRIIYANKAFGRLTGYSDEDIANGLRHIDIVHPSDVEYHNTQLSEQLKQTGSFSIQYRIIHKDGHIVWVYDNGAVIEGPAGEKNIQCILIDITVQKEQEKALSISEMKYEVALKLSEMTMFEYDIETKDLTFYGGAGEMYSLPDVVHDGVNAMIKGGFILPKYEAALRNMYARIESGYPNASCIIKACAADGTIHDFQLILNTFYNSDGLPEKAIGVRKNISQIRRLQKEEEFAKSFLTDKQYLFEADITSDKIIFMDLAWGSLLGITCGTAYSAVVERVAEQLIAPEHRSRLISHTAPEYITGLYGQGVNMFSFEYKYLIDGMTPVWFEASINTVRDDHSGNISIRFYKENITARKIKEQRAVEEQLLYESMVSKAELAYAVDLTNDSVISGNKDWTSLYGIDTKTTYSNHVVSFANKVCHPQDRDGYLSMLDRGSLISNFVEYGRREVSAHYRKRIESGEYAWHNCTMHIYEEPESGAIKAFCYVENIDEQKCAELSLIYDARHDKMTKLYNKAMTERLINDILIDAANTQRRHALLILDIDHFKSINDTFGHLFGDTVLIEIAQKLQTEFREKDIVGRIGGDEFCILMCDVGTEDIVSAKAARICRMLSNTYVKNGMEVSISASIGIAISGVDGCTYHQLFECADRALYASKQGGKNRYSFGF